MDDSNLYRRFERKIVDLQQSLYLEKLRSAEELLAHRLAFTAVIFVCLLLYMVSAAEDWSGGLRWFWFVLYLVAAFFVVGAIGNRYARDKKEAQR